MIQNKLLSELVKDYENNELDDNFSKMEMIPCYFTQGHKEKDMVCWTTLDNIKAMSEFKKRIEQIENTLLWENF